MNTSGTFLSANTTETTFNLNDVKLGDVYVIEIVASSNEVVGNGSATVINISKLAVVL